MKAFFKIIVWLIVVAFIALGILIYWHHETLYPSTDDSYLNANVIHISPQVSGPVTQIFVENYQTVKQGQPLLQIDPRPFQIAVNAAEAQLALSLQKEQSAVAAVNIAKTEIPQKQADLTLARDNARRILALVKDGQASKQQGDEVINQLQVTQAGLQAAYKNLDETLAELGAQGNLNATVRAAKAKLDQANLNLSYAMIIAPNNGIIVNFDVRPGTLVQAGNELFDIVENNLWWVDANFKETQLDRIRSGQSAIIVTDMYPDHPFKGQVYKVSPGSGAAFSLLPPENATGNWVKVTQRFPVKIIITNTSSQLPLRIGASAKVIIDTTHP
ncbi:MAG: hypothetical protein A3E87_00130 [Gammaproteobacteria bacterium RIFCSPHIGHO2_12_FULL_35_23]|nr:MAG: hypothetical protein A3E87_00130 [Gammaproteobacteria bacterium RIFCSPHIGHO2_12_FULL_35_23]